MPAKGSGYLSGQRTQTLTKELYNRFIEEKKHDISWEKFREIVIKSNKKIAECVMDDISGFKLPEPLGYICVIKYKSNKKIVDYKNSKLIGEGVPLTNLHSFGNRMHIKWFQVNNSRRTSIYSYRFQFCRNFTRGVAAKIKSGKQYHFFTNSDFWSKSKMSRMYSKYSEKIQS